SLLMSSASSIVVSLSLHDALPISDYFKCAHTLLSYYLILKKTESNWITIFATQLPSYLNSQNSLPSIRNFFRSIFFLDHILFTTAFLIIILLVIVTTSASSTFCTIAWRRCFKIKLSQYRIGRQCQLPVRKFG